MKDVQAVRGRAGGTKSSIAGVIEQMQEWGGAYSFLLEESATHNPTRSQGLPGHKASGSLRSGFWFILEEWGV